MESGVRRLSKAGFIIEFTLARARADIPNNDVALAPVYAIKAWNDILELLKKQHGDDPYA